MSYDPFFIWLLKKSTQTIFGCVCAPDGFTLGMGIKDIHILIILCGIYTCHTYIYIYSPSLVGYPLFQRCVCPIKVLKEIIHKF